MSMCLASKFGGLSVGIATLAQVVPSDPSATYEKYGWTGLLVMVVVALWIDGKREATKAEERRAAREAAQALRDDKHLEALNALTTAIRENAIKCESRCDQVENLVRAVTKT